MTRNEAILARIRKFTEDMVAKGPEACREHLISLGIYSDEDEKVDEVTIEVVPTRPQHGMRVGTDVGVKVTHPSGLVAISTGARTQHKNRQIAMDMVTMGLRALQGL